MLKVASKFLFLLILLNLIHLFIVTGYQNRISNRNANTKHQIFINNRNSHNIQATTVPIDVTTQLNDLKRSGKLNRWASSVTFAKPMSEIDLLFITRTSFSSTKYFDDLLLSMEKSKRNYISSNFVVSTIIFSLIGLIVIPQIHEIPVSVKNIFGLLSIAYPFIYTIVAGVSPDFIKRFDKILQFGKENEIDELERILYHEAGHMLVGYLCGVAISNYSIDGDIESQTAVEINPKYLSISMNGQQTSKQFNNSLPTINIGNLLVVAMAGVISETLIFGNSKGGGEDLQTAQILLNIIKTSNSDKIGYLRWATSKALTLLLINRNALDKLTIAMKNKADINECYKIIEQSEQT